jgi:ribosome-binding protein aMBF1 (putative translation factor)
MSAELGISDIEPVETTVRRIPDKFSGAEFVGTNITFHTEPPTEILVFSNRLNVKSGGLTLDVRGKPQFSWSEDELIVNVAEIPTGGTQVIFDNRGHLVGAHSTEATTPDALQAMAKGKVIKFDYDKLIAGVREDDPSTLVGIPYFIQVRYHRERLGFSREDFAERALLSVETVKSLETGRIRRTNLSNIERGLGFGVFGLGEVHPYSQNLRKAYDYETKRRKERRALMRVGAQR